MRGNMSAAYINALELTRNSVLRITDKQTIQLLEEYKKEECLWNTALEDYPNRSERLRAAEKIAAILNIKNFDARHVMMKFKNLRNSYCQELKKIAQSLNTVGTEKSAKLYKPKVPWFDIIDSFIRPHLQPSRPALTGEKPQKKRKVVEGEQEKRRKVSDIKVEFYESDGQDDWSIQTQTQTQDNVVPTAPTTTREITFTHSEPCPSEGDDQSNDSRAKKRRRSTTSTSPSEALNPTQVFLQNDPINHRSDDTFDNFGKYIASLLRGLPPNKALMLQPKILTMIVEEVAMKDKTSVRVEIDRLDDHSETD